MKSAKIAEFRNQIRSYLEYVARGGTVRIFDRNRPVAELIPVGSSEGLVQEKRNSYLLKAADSGLVQLAHRGPREMFWKEGPVKLSGKESAVDALLADRKHRP